jgi:hypothetical protein
LKSEETPWASHISRAAADVFPDVAPRLLSPFDPISPHQTPLSGRNVVSFFCLWIPQFPAWAVTQNVPEHAEHAFGVSENGRIVAASPLALEAGIETGMTDAAAKSLFPQVRLILRDRIRESLIWSEVQRSLSAVTPQIEPVSPGLLFTHIDARQMLPFVGQWNVCGGEGHDRASAQLAALTTEAGGVRGVRKGREATYADRVPLEALLPAGLSLKSLKKLHKFGYKNVGAVRRLNRQQLDDQWKGDAELLFRLSQAKHDEANLRPIATWVAPEEVSATRLFPVPCLEPGEWEPALDLLLKEVCAALNGRSAQSLEIIAHTAINPVAARHILSAPVARPQQLEGAARVALLEALQSVAPLPPVLTGLEVRLGALLAAPAQTTQAETEHLPLIPFAIAQRLRHSLEGLESRFRDVSREPAMGRFAPRDAELTFPTTTLSWFPALEQLAQQRELRKAAR